MHDWLTLRLIAERLNDQFLLLNGKIVSSKGNRPVWKISDIADRDGQIVEHIVDDLQALRIMVEQLRQCANDAYHLHLTGAPNNEI